MFQPIRHILFGDSRKNSRRERPMYRASRRLGFEGLEGREMLTGTIASVSNAISDSSFEAPALLINRYQYDPSGSPWQFSGAAGISSKGSAFTSNNPGAPDGTQVAFLQGVGSMSQSVYVNAGAYCISFQAAQRAGKSQANSQTIQVQVDGKPVGSITPNGTNYSSYQTSAFTLTSGQHNVAFVGLNPQGGDNTALVDQAALGQATDTISNGSFETPGLPYRGFQYAPSGSSWQFSGSAGISRNSSTFTANNPNAPDGLQVAFLQGSGIMSQSAYLDAGTYNISFQAAQRAGKSQAHYQEIQVLVDNRQVGLTVPGNTAYGLYETSNFTVAAGTHVIKFVGLNPLGGDNTAFLDAVTIASATDSISDGGFEAPGLPVHSFQSDPSGSPWQFFGSAGVSRNGSGFTSKNSGAPDGVQVAYLQGSGGMSQSVYLDAGAYNISYQAAQRAGKSQAHYQQLQVLVDGTQVSVTIPTGTSYGLYQTSNFTVSAGMHTITFVGQNPLGGDNTAFVDAVAVAPATSGISDGNFEAPGLPSNNYQAAPGGSPWQFYGSAGVSSNGSAFTSNNPNAPDGSQVAYLQGSGTMSQTIYADAGAYSISFQAAQRSGSPQSQQIQVLVDGHVVGMATLARTSYGLFQTPVFTLSAGSHVVKFVALNPQGGDNTALLDGVAIVPQADAVSNGSFEVPGLAASSFKYAPDGTPWLFSGAAGVSSNGSSFTSGNPNAPDGSQVAFLQGSGCMSQSLYLDAGTYSLSFQAAQRAGSVQTNAQEIKVLVDNVVVGLITPTTTGYATYQTSNFTVTSALHTLKFVGLDPQGGDNTAFVDQVTLLPPTDSITDGSFERPGLASKSFQYTPAGSPWQFTGQAGVSGNGSTFTAANPNAPDGTQVAFLENYGSMSQGVSLSGGAYSISFKAAQRGGTSQSHYQEIQVLVDGNQVGEVAPVSTSYAFYQTPIFSIAAGTHTIELAGLDPQALGDNTALIDQVVITQADTVSDSSFEAPGLAVNSYLAAPAGSPWQFSAAAGVSSNGSTLTSSNPNAPDGSQVAYIQGTGTMSQTLLLDPGTYSLTFLAAQRAGSAQSSFQEIRVLIDGNQVGLITPASTNYASYQTSPFTVSSGFHTLTFVGVNPQGGNNTALIDEVQIS